jgi:phosphotransferase system HPr (HPr) family protein
MNSIRYRIQNPWGLHARSSAFVVRVIETCAAQWEVIASVRENECNAKSIMSLMKLGAAYGTEIEFLSLMPDELWVQFTSSLEALFYVVDHNGNKANAYEPVEKILTQANAQSQPSCSIIRNQLQSRSVKYNCGPFFEVPWRFIMGRDRVFRRRTECACGSFESCGSHGRRI